jgi:predicted amidophosphoribosyltransferase
MNNCQRCQAEIDDQEDICGPCWERLEHAAFFPSHSLYRDLEMDFYIHEDQSRDKNGKPDTTEIDS